jgi:hemolysin activation/secretion protein
MPRRPFPSIPALSPAPSGSRKARGPASAAIALCLPALAVADGQSAASEAEPAPSPVPERRLYVREYRVLGAKAFPKVQVEEAVYPYLGPGRSEEDVEAARAALEKAYHDAGYQAASVSVPAQSGTRGIVFLQVAEGTIARLRVKGSRFFLPSDIKRKAQSLAEGQALDFNRVQADIMRLNQLPDRQVTPSLAAGAEPGTVDVELTVKDKFPLHGSVELNNRYSADTSPLRLSASLSYNNLWQAGHTVGASYQMSPQEPDEVKVISGYYLWRFQNLDWLSLMANATKSDSNVSTLGSIAVAGRGETYGLRAIFTLPTGRDFFHSINAGLDYKHYEQDVTVAGITSSAPVTYYPLSAAYSATWAPKGSTTELNLGVTLGIRGAGSERRRIQDDPLTPEREGGFETDEFEESRFRAGSNFLLVRGDLSHERTLPGGFEVFGKVQGQASDQPLVSNEQFAGGGLATARGYLEAEVLGDYGVFGTLEVRSPQLLGWLPERWKGNEWRIHLFGDAGALWLHSPLPEQERDFSLASFGVGSRLQLFDHIHGSIDLAFPAISQTQTRAGDPFVSFRVWADF